MKKIKYFVSYMFGKGFGHADVWLDKEEFNVVSVGKIIAKRNNFKEGSVIILFFKKFEKGEVFE